MKKTKHIFLIFATICFSLALNPLHAMEVEKTKNTKQQESQILETKRNTNASATNLPEEQIELEEQNENSSIFSKLTNKVTNNPVVNFLKNNRLSQWIANRTKSIYTKVENTIATRKMQKELENKVKTEAKRIASLPAEERDKIVKKVVNDKTAPENNTYVSSENQEEKTQKEPVKEKNKGIFKKVKKKAYIKLLAIKNILIEAKAWVANKSSIVASLFVNKFKRLFALFTGTQKVATPKETTEAAQQKEIKIIEKTTNKQTEEEEEIDAENPDKIKQIKELISENPFINDSQFAEMGFTGEDVKQAKQEMTQDANNNDQETVEKEIENNGKNGKSL